MRQKGERSGNAAESTPPTVLFPLMALGAIGETRVLRKTGEIQTGGLAPDGPPLRPIGELKGSITKSQPVAPPSGGAISTAPRTSDANDVQPSPVHDVAFALRLTWQARGTNTNATVTTRTGQSSGQSEIVASQPDTAKAGISKPDSVPVESQSSPRNDQFARSSFSLPQSIQACSPGSDSTAPEGARLRLPETLQRIRPVNLTAAAASQDQDPPTETATNFTSIDPEPKGPKRAPAPSTETPPASSLPAADNPDAATTQNEVRAGASTSLDPSLEEGRAESAAPRRLPVASSQSISETQGTPPNDSGNMMGRDTANSESNPKVPRIQIAEKAPQVQNNNQPGGHGAAGVWLDRAAVPGGAVQTQTKISAPEPPHPVSTSPELEATRAVQPQAIREISFRLAADSANVDVQVAERAGRIQVAVRTSDPDLAKSLQTNLGELVGRLEDKGFRTEAWTPVTAQHGGGTVREPSNSTNSQSQSDDSGRWGGQQDERRGQKESNQRQQGRWETQLEETPMAKTFEEEKR
jgi:hypothetical protein